MDNLLNNLLEMGFERSRAEKALKATSSKGLAEAMDWLIAHEAEVDKLDLETLKPCNAEEASVEIVHEKLSEKVAATVSVPTESATSPKSADTCPKSDEDSPCSTPSNANASEVAHSYKCDECGRLLKNEQELQFHAAKSNHTQFSESTEIVKALTEEEKKIRLLQLQERLRLKRAEKEDEAKKSALEAEKHRRRTGQEILASKQRMEALEMKKIADDRKRQKKEDALAKKKILDEIQRDKEARKQQQGNNSHQDSLPKLDQETIASMAPANYEDCRIQIRMLNGSSLTHTFKAREQLSAVRLYAELNRTDDVTVPFNLMTNMPKRIFADQDMDATLEYLGLVPSAVLTMIKKA